MNYFFAIFIQDYDFEESMKTEMITIPKQEYDKLKKLEKIDFQFLKELKESLEDAKHGRIRRVA